MHRLQKMTQENLSKDWSAVWLGFCKDPWVMEQFENSSRSVLRRLSLPASWKDDLKQEAILGLARQLMNDTTLGFLQRRGGFQPFLSTVIFRCCQKSARQFQNCQNHPLNEECHPWFDPTKGMDVQIDIQENASIGLTNQRDQPFKPWLLGTASKK